MPDDARIGEESFDVCFLKVRDGFGDEIGEGSAKSRPFAENRQPGKPGLETLQTELLKQSGPIGHRPSPFVVVIGDVLLRAGPPPAPRETVLKSF